MAHWVTALSFCFFFVISSQHTARTSTESPGLAGLDSVIDEISPREIDAHRYRLVWMRFDAFHDAWFGIAFPSSSLPSHPLARSRVLPLSSFPLLLLIPFLRDSLSGFRHRPRRCRFFYSTSSRLSSPFARVLTAARVILSDDL